MFRNSKININLLGQDYITLNNQTFTVNKIDLSDDVVAYYPNSAPMKADPVAARIVLTY